MADEWDFSGLKAHLHQLHPEEEPGAQPHRRA